jgi:integrase
MSHTAQPISPLRQRMIEDMTLRKLAPKTQNGYIRWVKRLAAFLKRSPATATAEDLRRFQLDLVERGVGRGSVNAAVTALQFFFDVTLGRGEPMAKMSHVHQPRKLPTVLGREEVERFLEAAPGLKYKATLSVALWGGSARRRGSHAESRRYRQQADGHSRRPRKGAQGPLCAALADLAWGAAGVLARGQRARQDAAPRLAVPGPGPRQPALDPSAQPCLSRRRREGRHRQAGLAPYV